MIQLPPGCTVNYPITVEIDALTDNMIAWYKTIGGQVMQQEHWDSRGRRVVAHFVQYGKAKYCHHRKDGTNGVRLHFHGDDASVASLFLLTFSEHVEQHNLVDHYSLQ